MSRCCASLSLGLSLFLLANPTLVRASQAGQPAPAFELVSFGGESYSHESLKGRPVLFVFWAPWCNVCQRELPRLSQFYQRDKPKTLEVVSIGFAGTRTNVEQFVKQRSATFVYPTAYDEDRWVAQAFKVNATPTYVLLDARGSVVLIHRGGGVFERPGFLQFVSRSRDRERITGSAVRRLYRGVRYDEG